MQSTTHPDRAQTDWRTRVAVRVPRDGKGDLTTAAARRLESPTGIEDATVEAVRGLEPALAATVVQLDVRLQTNETVRESTVEALLGDAPGTERVETVEAVDTRPTRVYGPPP